MSRTAFRKHKKLYITLIVIAAVLLAAAVAFTVYVCDYYHADLAAIGASPFGQGVIREEREDFTVFYPADTPVAGLIFYPGGKVEHTAYTPLMQALAEQGVLCVLVEMPLRLAVLDIDAADGIQAQFPTVSRWYMGGHSLGGSMAASYLEEHAAEYEGLLLLAAYSATDLSHTELRVLSVYGERDGVLNRESYAEGKSALPADFTEYVIAGGNHAGFGMYGAQEGDGEATLSAVEQIRLTAARFAAFLQEK